MEGKMSFIEQKYVEPPFYVGNISNVTLYDAYINANKDNLDNIALYTMDGKPYTHKELCKMIDSVTVGFWNMGIRQGDKIGIMTNNTVEEAVCLLALNRLGAISVFVDISKEISDIKDSLNNHRLKLLILDENVLNMEQSINASEVPIIVIGENGGYHKGITIDELYKNEMQDSLCQIVTNNNLPAVIINSSGTTGSPKPIVHTSYSINMAAYKIMCTDYSLNRENVIMKVIPSYIGLGLITTLYTSLLCGTKVVLINGNGPQQSIENTIKFITEYSKFRNTVGLNKNAKLIIFAAPMFFRALANHVEGSVDLSYIETMLAAGSKMGEKELETIHSILKQAHCSARICNGYGQNEMCGAVTLNSNRANKNGSAGFPVIGTEICVVDPDTLEVLKTNQEGLVLERSNSLFLRYENMPVDTEKAFIKLKNGTEWFNTKDIGYVDEDGFLYITGRISRVLVRYDCKISVDKIEEKIKNHPSVLDCAVIVCTKNDVEEMAIAFVSIKDVETCDAEGLLRAIQKSNSPLSDFEIPESFILLPQIPYMKNGKVDYLKLEKMILSLEPSCKREY